MKIHIKRAYDPPSRKDGKRILVDRLWPRGISKSDAKIDFWAKEIAPSEALRRWYRHDPNKWEGFKAKYFKELKSKNDRVEELLGYARKGTVTFIFGSKDPRLNNASALKTYIELFSRDVSSPEQRGGFKH